MRLWAIVFLLSFISIAGTACRHRYDPVHNDRRVQQFERNLIEVAARDSGCSPVQVQPTRIGETVWVANTCTGPREYFLDCRNRGRRWASCQWDRIMPIQESAAQVFACPPPSIGVAPTAVATTRIVSGCGASVQMSLRCNQVGCGWLPDGPPQGAAQQQAMPPPPVDYAAPRVVVIPAPTQ